MSTPRDLNDIDAERRYAPAFDLDTWPPSRWKDFIHDKFAYGCTGNAITCTRPYSDCAKCHGLDKPIERSRLDDIATLVRLLAYGEMMNLATALWKMRPEDKEVTEQELPGIWHRWSKK